MVNSELLVTAGCVVMCCKDACDLPVAAAASRLLEQQAGEHLGLLRFSRKTCSSCVVCDVLLYVT